MKQLLNRWHNIPIGVKASVAYFFASMVTKAIVYLVTPIFTRLLTPAEFGRVSVYLTWKETLGIVAMFCLSYGVFNNGMLDHENDRDGYSFSMLILANIITAVCTVLVLSVHTVVGGFAKLPLPFLLLMLTGFFFQPALDFWMARQRYEYRYKGPVLVSILTSFLSASSAVIGILIFRDNRPFGRVFGSDLVFICTGLFFYIYLARQGRKKFNPSYWKEALSFNLPLIPHYLSTYLLGNSDKLMIDFLIGSSATAYYSVAHSIAAVVIIVWSAANTSLIPFTYEKCRNNDFDAISRVTLPILTVFGVACIFMILLAPEAIALISTKDYMEAIYVVPPIVGGVFFQTNYYIYANILYYYKKPKMVMLGSLTATGLNIILNYIFISRFGYIAAGYTTLFCYLVQAAIDYIGMYRVLHRSVYRMDYIGLLAGGIILISIFSKLIYDYRAIRYGIVVALILAAIIFHKKMIQIFLFSKGEQKNET
ncbi:MAG: oligosaccharide flippase family protein [Clostridia bacterium]|nr:oligosaccharide flippase family protein [Clostridia bacterium]